MCVCARDRVHRRKYNSGGGDEDGGGGGHAGRKINIFFWKIDLKNGCKKCNEYLLYNFNKKKCQAKQPQNLSLRDGLVTFVFLSLRLFVMWRCFVVFLLMGVAVTMEKQVCGRCYQRSI